jgi:hypothetical protein
MNAVAALLIDLTAHVPQRFDLSAWWEAVEKPASDERTRRAVEEGERRRGGAG